jgi:hypothetical protein
VLRSDALEVKARLARERQRLSEREHLNQLLGRDVACRWVGRGWCGPGPGAQAVERPVSSIAERALDCRTVSCEEA